MHDTTTHIEAFIRPYGSKKPYFEYEAAPGTPLHTGKPRERYIEATSGERFEVGVQLHPQFQLGGYSAVEMRYNFDGGAMKGVRRHPLDSASATLTQKKEIVCNSKTMTVNGQVWRKGFAFQELRIDECADLTTEQEQRGIETLGIITIAIQLGTETSVRRARRKLAEYTDLSQSSTSKKVAIDNGKTHCFKAIDDGPSGSNFKIYDFKPARGKMDQVVTFTFHYAARDFLERKQIMPPRNDSDPTASELSLVARPGQEQDIDGAISAVADAPEPAGKVATLASCDERAADHGQSMLGTQAAIQQENVMDQVAGPSHMASPDARRKDREEQQKDVAIETSGESDCEPATDEGGKAPRPRRAPSIAGEALSRNERGETMKPTRIVVMRLGKYRRASTEKHPSAAGKPAKDTDGSFVLSGGQNGMDGLGETSQRQPLSKASFCDEEPVLDLSAERRSTEKTQTQLEIPISSNPTTGASTSVPSVPILDLDSGKDEQHTVPDTSQAARPTTSSTTVPTRAGIAEKGSIRETIKVESEELVGAESARATRCSPIVIVDDSDNEPPSKKIKTEGASAQIPHGADRSHGLGDIAAQQTPLTNFQPVSRGRAARERERARVLLSLEEIQLKRKLLDLDDEAS